MDALNQLKDLALTVNLIRAIKAGQATYELARFVLSLPEPERTESVKEGLQAMPFGHNMTPADFIVRAKYIAKMGPVVASAEKQMVCCASFDGPSNDQCYCVVHVPNDIKDKFFAEILAREEAAEAKGCKMAEGQVALFLDSIVK